MEMLHGLPLRIVGILTTLGHNLSGIFSKINKKL
jgi:Flp pilus assembly pilin Flp